ncbi:MAG TPA: hypothetical protein VMK12_25155, partial [Anaeromyxobacteraceae bacterium]|nr:hypothetical protein [Anaeromyxobacteraceae bacterium]
MSLDTLGTDDAKRPQIEKLQSDLYACMAPAREVERALLKTLADGVAAGAIEPTSAAPLLAQLEANVATVHDCSADAVNKLHALLSPTERAALAEKVKAHWEVWHQSHEEQAGGQGKGG